MDRIQTLKGLLAPARRNCDLLPLLDPRGGTGWEDRAAAARDLTLDRDALQTLARDSSKQVRGVVRLHPLLPDDLRQQLNHADTAQAWHPTWSEDRSGLARQQAAPGPKPSDGIRIPASFASYPTTPHEMLSWLAAGHPLVAAVVADRDDLADMPAELVAMLADMALQTYADDGKVEVGRSLVRNPACPGAVVDRLASAGGGLAAAARQHPACDLSQVEAASLAWPEIRAYALPRLPDDHTGATLAALVAGWDGTVGDLLTAAGALVTA